MATPEATKRKYQNLKIEGAEYGGFIVWTQARMDYEAPLRNPLYSGSLADCLAFMGAELGKPTDVKPFTAPSDYAKMIDLIQSR